MTTSLFKKGMELSSKYDVEVMIVVLNKSTGMYHEFCTTDHQHLFEEMLLSRLKNSNVQSYTLSDLPSLVREEQSLEKSPELRKQPRTTSPAPSDLSSQLSSIPSCQPQKTPSASAKPPRSRENGVAGFLAMLQKNTLKKPPPTLSTADSVADLPPPAPPSQPHPLPEPEEDEVWHDSPSDFLMDL